MCKKPCEKCKTSPCATCAEKPIILCKYCALWKESHNLSIGLGLCKMLKGLSAVKHELDGCRHGVLPIVD